MAGEARAFSPDAAAAVAARVSGALPPAARWNSAWDAAAAYALNRRFEAELADPERYVPLHRFQAGDASAALLAAGVADAGAVTGRAPLELASAAAALRAAFEARDAEAIVETVARVAQAATDLSDPFLTTPLDRDEVPGSRAAFGDLLADADLAGLAVTPEDAMSVLAAGEGLAGESAALRSAVEQAVTSGDAVALATLRRGRLNAALALAGAITREAWLAAESRALDGGVALEFAKIWPNPARSQATVAFTLPAAGAARIELFDLAGRRVWSRALPAGPAGPRILPLEPGALSALAPGVYMLRVSSRGYEARGRLTRIAN